MTLCLFWNAHGVKEESEGYPTSLQTWVAGHGQQLDEAQQMLLDAVEAALSTKIVKTDLLAENGNLMVKVEYGDGRQDAVRSPFLYDDDGKPYTHLLERFLREVNLLRWLKSHMSLPVPEVRNIIEGPHPGKYPYAVIEMLPGTMLMNAFGRLPYSAKERTIHTFADFSVKLFRLQVPQRIGTLCCLEDGDPEVIPWQEFDHDYRALQVYDTLEDFVDFLIQRKLQSDCIGSDEDSHGRGERVLARLASELSPIIKQLSSPSYRRCVLTHDDLHATNILVSSDTGELTGVIDWEHQSVLPAVLSVTYPSFLRCETSGRAVVPDEGGMNTMWSVSPEDAAELRKLFANIVESTDREYYEALVNGETLREAFEWLGTLHSDEGCVTLEKWMDLTFVHHV